MFAFKINSRLVITRFLDLEEYKKSSANALIDAYREAVRKDNTFVGSILNQNIPLAQLKYGKSFFKSNKNINGLLHLSENC